MGVMDTTYTAPSGATITCNDDTAADLRALSTLTREPEHVLLAAAVEALRTAKLRTATPRTTATAKARKSAQ